MSHEPRARRDEIPLGPFSVRCPRRASRSNGVASALDDVTREFGTAREGVANAVEGAGGAGSLGRAPIRAVQESFVDGRRGPCGRGSS
ncbi:MULTISPECIES: hypothetical protein [unclassified Streptomyces]|uniref:hypothetical protein n=1 Tax=unclassified Streptomyces TaxID=2593676 RepID=UPI0027DF53A4|nr:hypothetical protein [Streptomyces sp. CB02980]